MRVIEYVFILLFAGAIIALGYLTQQNNFILNFSLYSIAFGSFIYLFSKSKQIEFKKLALLALILHGLVLFSVPLLSPDYFRFIWDGELVTMGINPFSHKPEDLIALESFQNSAYLKELYAGITDLSREHYSCYPTINQFYFLIGSIFTENLYLNVIIMRLAMFLTTILGFKFSLKLLELLKIDSNRIWIVALNPFIILELTSNLHFEGVMMSFIVIALYFIIKNKLFIGAAFWAIAVNVKLTPMLLLPFFFKKNGLRKSILFYSSVIVITVILLILSVWPIFFDNFLSSLTLYFNNFEFNSSVFGIVTNLFKPIYDWETVLIVGPVLSKISLFLIVLFSLVIKVRSYQEMIKFMLIGFTTYLLLSSTIHPWYVAIPLILSVFTKFNAFIVWSFLVMLSYVFYELGDSTIKTVLTWVEYVVFIGYFVYELLKVKVRDNLLSS